MELGIDFGTTRTVVSVVDRGNYPVVGFLDTEQDSHDYYPSVIASGAQGMLAGFEALAAADEGAALLRSVKRSLADPQLTLNSTVELGGEQHRIFDLLTFYLRSLYTELTTRSTIAGELTAPPTVVIAVPAHATTAQRLLTLDAFQTAGFDVAGMLNEPSAAAFEYTHRQPRSLSSRRTRVVIYDLGGGTFDASLVNITGTHHAVEMSVGENRLGGDDFDALLVDVARETADHPDLSPRQLSQLLDDARDAKEHLSPQTKRIALEVGDEVVLVPVARFYETAAPLVTRTIDTMRPLMTSLDDELDLSSIAGIYLVGGGSGLPLVPRVLRETFGRRVHRSPQPGASTAIGLALAADPSSPFRLADRLSRGFGVFREGRSGRSVQFDPILDRETIIDAGAPVTLTRRYRAAHNVGWFRFVEYHALDDSGTPRGDITPFAQVLFPFVTALQDGRDLSTIPVERTDQGHLIEERYTVDGNQIISVTITDLDSGHHVETSLTGT